MSTPNETGAPRQESAQTASPDASPYTATQTQTWHWKSAVEEASRETDSDTAIRANIERYLRFIGWQPGQWIELQVLKSRVKNWDLGPNAYAHANQLDDIVRLCWQADSKAAFNAPGVYLIANAINEAITARAPRGQWNKIEQGTTDKDITRRLAFFWDFDAKRPSGISATSAEMRHAFQRACRAYCWLCELIGAEYFGIGMSGNGGQVHGVIDTPSTDEVTTMIYELLSALDFQFSDPATTEGPRVEVDLAVYDAKRLGPAWGTMKRKGEHTPERPHRRTFFVCPPNSRPLTLDELRALHAQLVTDEVRAHMAAKSKNKTTPRVPTVAGNVTVTTSTATSDGAESVFTRLNAAAPIADVMRTLGLDPDRPQCLDPACAQTEGVGLDAERNGLKCFHQTCGARWLSPCDLVAKVAFGTEIKGTKGIVAKLAGWFREHFDTDVGRDNKRVEVEITTREHDVNDQVIAALAEHDQEMYARNGFLARIVRDSDSYYVIRDIEQPTLRERISRCVDWFVDVPEERHGQMVIERKHLHAPSWAIPAIWNRIEWPGIRELRGVTEVPVLRSDGTLLSEPGYDPVSRLYYQPSIEIDPISDAPTREEALASLASLKDLVCDFPFDSIELPDGTVITAEHHCATWLAGLFTAFAMHYITSPVPMTAMDGNVPGAGKGLLIDMIATLLLGTPAPAMGAPKTMDELDKRISAKGKAAIQMLKVDNVKGQLGGDIWEALATTRRWNGRELGKSLDLTVRIDFPIFFSANGFQPVGDMPRRVLRCALQHPDEKPEECTGFKYPELLDHIRQNRAKYVRDVLVILRAYIAAGKPSQGVRLGSYEHWAQLVPSALVWLGEPDVTVTRRYYATTVSSDKSRLSALLTAWYANYGATPTLARTVIEDVERAYEDRTKDLRDALARFAWGGKELSSKALGSNLTQYKSRNIDGMRIASIYDKHAKVERWYVEQVAGTSEAPVQRALALVDSDDSPAPPLHDDSTEYAQLMADTRAPDAPVEQPSEVVSCTNTSAIESKAPQSTAAVADSGKPKRKPNPWPKFKTKIVKRWETDGPEATMQWLTRGYYSYAQRDWMSVTDARLDIQRAGLPWTNALVAVGNKVIAELEAASVAAKTQADSGQR